MEPGIHGEYTVVGDAKTLWQKLASAYKSKLKLNIFEITEDLCSIKLQNCGDADNYVSQTDRIVKNYNLCAGPSNNDTDTADTDANAKTIAKVGEQEHIIYPEFMMDKNAKITATPDEIVIKLVAMEAAIKRDIGLAPEALLFATNGGKCSKGGKWPKRDKRDNKDDRKEKDLRKCFQCQW